MTGRVAAPPTSPLAAGPAQTARRARAAIGRQTRLADKDSQRERERVRE